MRPLFLLLACLLVACGAGGGAARSGPSPIVLVSLDTFRADRLGVLGNPRGLTPNIDAFAREGVLFDNAWSQAVQTAPSHTSLFTSRYPSETLGSDGHPYVPKDIPLLPQLLSIYGYQTGAFVGGGDLSRHRGLTPGFDTYETSVDFGSLWHTTPLATKWLDGIDRSKPYFLFVHGYDTHSRYLKPAPYGYVYADARGAGVGQYAVRSATERVIDGVIHRDFTGLMSAHIQTLRPRAEAVRAQLLAEAGPESERVAATEADLALMRSVYDGAVSYADAMFGLLMAELAARGVLDEAIVVLLSDHGEGLGENGLFGHCCDAQDEETHVPVIVRLPGGAGGGARVSARIELIDVMPTLLELTEVTPPARIHGQSFAAALRGQPFEGRPFAHTQGSSLMRQVTLRGDAGRLTYTGVDAGSPYLADLVETAAIDGPGFRATPGLGAEDRAAMRAAMVPWLRGLAASSGGSHGEMPEELRKSLREHGYWDVKP